MHTFRELMGAGIMGIGVGIGITLFILWIADLYDRANKSYPNNRIKNCTTESDGKTGFK